jgi:CubicO group peptidase (beta-lactamase class C family)
VSKLILDRRQFVASAGLASAGLAAPAWAAKAKKRDVSASWPKLQAVLDDWVTTKKVPGAAASVAKGLDQADFMVAGNTAFDTKTAITPDTLFRCYSQTKPVTGMAIMMLIEDGKIGMDQNVADFIPAFANPRVMIEPTKSLKSRPAMAPIRIRDLLTHTAGLGYTIVTKGPLLDAYNELGITPAQVSRHALPGQPKVVTAPSLEEFANRLGTLPLIGDPGRKWSYSVSLDLLGRVVEVASGMSFDAFLQKRIFDPLGMTSTWFQVPASATSRFTTNHIQFGGVPVPIDKWDDSIYSDKPAFPFGGAGLVSSMRDWDRFSLMLMGEGAIGKTRIMKAETARWGMSNLVHPDTEMGSFVKDQGFGAGGRVTLKPTNGEGIGTYGWGGAASTIFAIDRTRQIRSSGWVQLMTVGGPQNFPDEVAKAIYGA